jgi:hypothetical protein
MHMTSIRKLNESSVLGFKCSLFESHPEPH